jgi:hypothetical protein
MAPISRLVAVQGPLQMLYAVAVLLFEAERNPEASFSDHLVLHGMGPQSTPDGPIHRATLEIARIWPWNSMSNLHAFETQYNYERDTDFDACADAVRHVIGRERFGVIYAVRNWQLTNDLILRAYPESRKIVYGDLGWIDATAAPDSIPFDEARPWLLPVQTHFDVCGRRTALLGRDLPFETVGLRHFREAIDHAAVLLAPALADLAVALSASPAPKVLVLTSNIADSRECRLEDEVELTVSTVLTHLDCDAVVVIKPHPRETMEQSVMIAEAIGQETGCRPTILDGLLGALPVEIIHQDLRFDRVIAPMWSSSSYTLRLLHGVEVVDATDKRDYWRTFIGTTTRRRHARSFRRYCRRFLRHDTIFDSRRPVTIGPPYPLELLLRTFERAFDAVARRLPRSAGSAAWPAREIQIARARARLAERRWHRS